MRHPGINERCHLLKTLVRQLGSIESLFECRPGGKPGTDPAGGLLRATATPGLRATQPRLKGPNIHCKILQSLTKTPGFSPGVLAVRSVGNPAN